MDRLAALFERFSLRTHVFNTGPLCGAYNYAREAGRGHIHVLKAGSLRVETPGQRARVIRAPHLLFYLKPVTHRLVCPQGEQAVTVCGEIEFGDGLENPLAQVLPDLISVPLQDQSSLLAILALLFEEAFNPACGRQAAMNRLSELLVIQLLRASLDNDSSGSGLLAGLADKRLARALDRIHRHPAEPWTLELLAMEAGMSRASFAVKFRETLGMTPGDYVSHWRLGVAKSLLKEGRPVSLVADEVGYSNAAAFSRAFTGRFGVTPTAWMKRVRQSSSAIDEDLNASRERVPARKR